MLDAMYYLHRRAYESMLNYGIVAMAGDSAMGPRNLPQCWNDCGQILTPFVCQYDRIRLNIVWNRNWNRPRIDFVAVLAAVYEQ